MAVHFRNSFKVLHRNADRHLPAYEKLWLEYLRTVSAGLHDPVLGARPVRPATAVDVVELLGGANTVMMAVLGGEVGVQLTGVYASIAQGTAEELVRQYGLVGRFDLINPRVAEAAFRHQARLVTAITADTRAAISRLVTNSVQFGMVTPAMLARQIREVVGLTTRQAVAVFNYRAGLERAYFEGRALSASEQARWSLGARSSLIRSEEQIDRLVSKYADRQLRLRSQMIARTETMRAANEGQRLLWDDMGEQGFIDIETTRRVWECTEDDRLCEECESLAGETIAYNGVYSFGDGGVGAPPLHVACRCTEYLETELDRALISELGGSGFDIGEDLIDVGEVA